MILNEIIQIWLILCCCYCCKGSQRWRRTISDLKFSEIIFCCDPKKKKTNTHTHTHTHTQYSTDQLKLWVYHHQITAAACWSGKIQYWWDFIYWSASCMCFPKLHCCSLSFCLLSKLLYNMVFTTLVVNYNRISTSCLFVYLLACLLYLLACLLYLLAYLLYLLFLFWFYNCCWFCWFSLPSTRLLRFTNLNPFSQRIN